MLTNIINEIKDLKKGIIDVPKDLLITLLSRVTSDKERLVYVAFDNYEAQEAYEKFCYVLGKDNVAFFPVDDIIRSKVLSKSKDFFIERLFTKTRLLKANIKVLVTSLFGSLLKMPSPLEFSHDFFVVNNKTRKEIIKTLEVKKYERETLTYAPGKYSIRGGVIDVFPITSDKPIRITFFGDDIEDIRFYNPETQLTTGKTKENIDIISNCEEEGDNTIIDYLTGDKIVFVASYEQITIKYDEMKTMVKEEQLGAFPFHIPTRLLANEFIFSNTVIKNKELPFFNIKAQGVPDFSYSLADVVSFIENSSRPTTVTYKDKNQEEILKALLKEEIGKCLIIREDQNELSYMLKDELLITSNSLFKANTDIFGAYRSFDSKLHNIVKLSELTIGDYVVHLKYGIGKYLGIKTFSFADETNDFISIHYNNQDLSIPVSDIYLLKRYESLGGEPKLSTLGTKEWENKKKKAMAEINEFTERIIKLEFERKKIKGVKYLEDTEIQKAFEEDFPYVETTDQLKTVSLIKKELEEGKLVDRIICGDVGFGKTEIAMRIAMKTVLNGYQVAFLAPTTILTKQHYETFKNRFSKYGVNVELINRFKTAKEKTEIIKNLKNGKIDILIGTHALLNPQVVFKNLNLLVIDEEQRFGVKDKQKISEVKHNVNVLSLSATPIPRTLQLALSKIRQLSIVKTPPLKKIAPETFVLVYNKYVIKDAINQELSRNGQVFYLTNDLAFHEHKVKEMKSLVPKARVVNAHGQMNKQELEGVVEDFINKKYDVLIATTIIETGIDIPNVNTLIVEDSQNLGLAQMYQLRGRVGRGDKVSYAYFTIPKVFSESEAISKRLEAIKGFTELGSGYRIAMEDLLIRGAGNLLGTKQSGRINDIGLGTYMELLENEIKKHHNEKAEETRVPDKININRYIPSNYVLEDELRLYIHKNILNIKSREDREELITSLTNRFGLLSSEILTYINATFLEQLFNICLVEEVHDVRDKVVICFKEELTKKVKGEAFLEALYKTTNNCARFSQNRFVLEIKKQASYASDWIDEATKIFENLQKIFV